MELPELVEFVKVTGETRNSELKRSMSWKEEETKFKITKSIMAMSNIRDGGTIILGVEEKANGGFDPVGMNTSDIDSFNFNNLQDHVNRYAHPYAKFLISHIPDIQPRFLVVQVEQFDEIPVICSRNYCVSAKYKMMEGEIYTRTRTKPQSSKVMNYLDLKEIIDLAIERGVKLFIERSRAAGLALGQPTGAWDEEQFSNQIEKLL